MSADTRLKRYRAAIYAAHCALSVMSNGDQVQDAIAKACMAQADAEIAHRTRLLDEVIGRLEAERDAADAHVRWVAGVVAAATSPVGDGVTEAEHLERVERQRGAALAEVERLLRLLRKQAALIAERAAQVERLLAENADLRRGRDTNPLQIWADAQIKDPS